MKDIDLDNIEAAANGQPDRGPFTHPADTLLLVAEVRRLRIELAGAYKANSLMMKGMDSQCEVHHDLKQRARSAEVLLKKLYISHTNDAQTRVEVQKHLESIKTS